MSSVRKNQCENKTHDGRQMQVKEQSVGASLSFQLRLITSSQLHCLCLENDAPYNVPVNSHLLWTADRVTPCFPFPQINSSLSFMFDVVSIIKFYSSAVSSPKWQLIFRSAILGVGWGGGCSLLSQNFIVVHLLSRRAT